MAAGLIVKVACAGVPSVEDEGLFLFDSRETPAMWCRYCQQQTPALGPPSANGPRCARCQRTSPATGTVGVAPLDGSHTAAEAVGSPTDPDDARRAIYRSLRSAHATLSAGEAARTIRFDVGQSPLVEASEPSRQATTRRPLPPSTSAKRSDVLPSQLARGQLTAWLMSSVGAMMVGLGIGLGAWSLIGNRADLWNPALAAAIGGQGLLIVGLLQLLASLWNAARLASGKLSLMHDELRQLRRTTDEAAGRNSASAAGFYADLARDAPPEMLMGNLRGQMDRLASRLRAD